MALSTLLAGLDSALASLEAITGETVTLGTSTVPCTMAADPEDQQTFEDGGTVFKKTASVNVRKSQLSIPNFFLDIGLSAVYRGANYRIWAIHDSSAYWKVDLQELEA